MQSIQICHNLLELVNITTTPANNVRTSLKPKLVLFKVPRKNGIEYWKYRENNRREESKYLECENRQLGLSAIVKYIFKPPTEKFKIGR